jgi:hypothetical protein
MRAEITQVLELWMRGCKCGWQEDRNDEYKSLQLAYGPVQMLKVPISIISSKMEAIPEETDGKSCSRNRRGEHEALKPEHTFRGKREAMKKAAIIPFSLLRA